MKKISVLIILALLLIGGTTSSVSAKNLFTKAGVKAEQKRLHKNTISEIKNVMKLQDEYANKHDEKGLSSLYSENFVNSDGFDKKIYFKLIKETWETYPDVSYKTEIKSIDYSDNYAAVFVQETAVATSVEDMGEFKTTGELFSTAKTVYRLERKGQKWIISSEKVIEETSSLKYGSARFVDIKLDTPKEIGAGKYYTTTLKIDVPKDMIMVGSISRENIVYPQVKTDDAFRKFSDNVLERVFKANTDNVNEYSVASVGLTHSENYDDEHIRVYLNGLAFIMTRVNVIPENKFIKLEEENAKDR